MTWVGRAYVRASTISLPGLEPAPDIRRYGYRAGPRRSHRRVCEVDVRSATLRPRGAPVARMGCVPAGHDPAGRPYLPRPRTGSRRPRVCVPALLATSSLLAGAISWTLGDAGNDAGTQRQAASLSSKNSELHSTGHGECCPRRRFRRGIDQRTAQRELAKRLARVSVPNGHCEGCGRTRRGHFARDCAFRRLRVGFGAGKGFECRGGVRSTALRFSVRLLTDEAASATRLAHAS
jgi:hypothetical protein